MKPRCRNKLVIVPTARTEDRGVESFDTSHSLQFLKNLIGLFILRIRGERCLIFVSNNQTQLEAMAID
jgi:hypothetical protein